MSVNKSSDGVVVLDYQDLIRSDVDLTASIKEGFGESGLGIILVRGVAAYPDLRKRLLPLSSRLARLPDDVKEQLVHKESSYLFGWSHGKEKFQGRFDLAKGSFYGNPCHDVPTTDPTLIASYPEYCHPNIWPKEHLPELEHAFKDLGRMIQQVGLELARHCDKYVASNIPDYRERYLEKVIEDTRACKARLLHYFPREAEEESDDIASWCGWHLDHSSLTGLTSAMYLNEKFEQVPCSDPKAGLYIRNRYNDIVKVSIPEDMIAFQIGEAAQVATGGYLKATPHCVRAAKADASLGEVARDTFAVFMQPVWDHMLTDKLSFVQYTKQLYEEYV